MTFQSNKKPKLINKENTQKHLQITQIYTCPKIQGVYLCLWDPFLYFQPTIPKSKSGHEG